MKPPPRSLRSLPPEGALSMLGAALRVLKKGGCVPPARSGVFALLLAVGVAAPGITCAQSAPVVVGTALIYSGLLAGATGFLSVNEAAGLNNAQSNVGVITSGSGGVAESVASQSTLASALLPYSRASISGYAFSNATGVLMVNQAAGAANVQRNSVVLGASAAKMEIVSDNELSATVAKPGGMDRSATVHGVREASIDDGAFRNVSGIAQINQTAGAGNLTANSFVLRPPAGTFF